MADSPNSSKDSKKDNDGVPAVVVLLIVVVFLAAIVSIAWPPPDEDFLKAARMHAALTLADAPAEVICVRRHRGGHDAVCVLKMPDGDLVLLCEDRRCESMGWRNTGQEAPMSDEIGQDPTS